MSAGDVEGFAINPTVVRAWKRYPAYKDSGVEWLGEVPVGWELVRLKYAVRMITQRTIDQNSNSNYIGLENIESWTGRLIASEDTLDPEGQSGSFESGDVLFGKLRPYLAKVHKATVDGICSTEILVFRPKLVNQDYLFYYLLNSEFIKTVNSSTYGTKMPRANWDFIGNLLIPNISLHDQHAIAAFLDRETARIDALIAKKQRFIELLEEKRQAFISHAVTKGLDPNVELKDSGVEWIGEVPAGWEIKKISYLADKITNGYVGPTRDIFVNNGVIYLQSLHIKRNQIIFDYNYYVSEEWSNKHPRSILKKGDVLIVQTGDIGQVAVVPEEYEGANCHALIIISCTPTAMKGEYLSMLLNSTYGFNSLKRIQTGALHPHLNYHNVKEILIPVPPISEQLAIVEWIVQSSSKIDALINIITLQIEKLHEYRTVLISAAVTGKIDVRGEEGAT